MKLLDPGAGIDGVTSAHGGRSSPFGALEPTEHPYRLVAAEHGAVPALVTPEELFAGHPVACAVTARVGEIVDGFGGVSIRTTKSQVAFRRRRGFAFVWRPGQYLAKPDAEAVLSIALGREDRSTRWKEVAHPSPREWIHHLEVGSPDELDDLVVEWLREASDRAG